MIDPSIVFIRLGLALLFGAVIGIEREWRHKNAGLKTNTLVTLGATVFAMVSNTFGPMNHNPAQIAASVVTGIGFIGAGVIIHRGASVQGVTTAATLWADAAVGVAVGIGQLFVGTVLFASIIFVQVAMRGVEVWFAHMKRHAATHVELQVECESASLGLVNQVWKTFADSATVVVQRRSTTRGTTCGWRSVFMVKGRTAGDVTGLEERLAALDGVHRVDCRFLDLDEMPQ
jgi:uncharacterized membrane protein YhiD involved in acid resistance